MRGLGDTARGGRGGAAIGGGTGAGGIIGGGLTLAFGAAFGFAGWR